MPADPTPDPDPTPDADGRRRPARARDADPFAPPKVPCEVQCVHCGESYESWQIEWRDDPSPDEDADGGPNVEPGNGAWCCPTVGCDGVGFGFDIFPADPAWVDENGEHLIAQLDDDDDDDEDDDEDDDGDGLHFAFADDEDDDEDDASNAGMPVDVFDADAFWIDADRIAPRALGNTPQPPFDVMPPSKLFESSDGEAGDDDLPF